MGKKFQKSIEKDSILDEQLLMLFETKERVFVVICLLISRYIERKFMNQFKALIILNFVSKKIINE